VLKRQKEGVTAQDNSNIFSYSDRGGSRPDDRSERNPVFLIPNLEHHMISSDDEREKAAGKT